LKLTLRLVMWLAAIISLMVVIQYFLGTGKSLFLGGQYSPGYTRHFSSEEQEMARSGPPGSYPMLVFFLVATTGAAYRGFRGGVVNAMAAALLGIGVLFSYYRSFWISSLLGVAIVWLIGDREVRRRLPVFAATTLMLVVVGGMLAGRLGARTAGEKFSRLVVQRFTSIFERQTYETDESFQNRMKENRYAIQQIKRSPVFGIGADAPRQYKEWTRPGFYTKVIYPLYYIHNSYLELWMVYGLLGILSFIWLSIVFLVRSFTLSRRARDPTWRVLAVSFFAGYIGFLVRCYTQMHIMHDYGQMVTVALMWGVIEVLWRLHIQADLQEARDHLPSQSGVLSTVT